MTYVLQIPPLPDVVLTTNSRSRAHRWARARSNAIVTGVENGSIAGRVIFQYGRRVAVSRPHGYATERYCRRLRVHHRVVELPPFTIWKRLDSR